MRSLISQQKRGNLDTFIGAFGEVIVDMTTFTLYIHDGVKPGGYPVKFITGSFMTHTVSDSGTSSKLTVTFEQQVPANTWNIVHNLGFNPNVFIADTTGDQILSDISYPNNNTVIISFTVPTSGHAYLT